MAGQFQPGISYDLPAADYHGIEALSASGSKKLLRSPAHFIVNRTRPSEPTEDMMIGSAVHLGVLEPEKFDQYVIESPVFNARTKDGRAERDAWVSAQPGECMAFAPDKIDVIRSVVDAVRAHPGAQRLLTSGRAEVSLQWRDTKYGIPCKSRVDYLREDGGMVDLKTCRDASDEAFSRTIGSYFYHLQAAFYMTGAEHLFSKTPPFFAFIAAEKEPPYGVACYVLDSASILAGQRHVETAMRRYKECLDSGEWPGYSPLIEPISAPRWALSF